MADPAATAQAARLLAEAGLVDATFDPAAVAEDLEARLALDRSLDPLIGPDDA